MHYGITVCAVNYCHPRLQYTTKQYITAIYTLSKDYGILLQLTITIVCGVLCGNLKLYYLNRDMCHDEANRSWWSTELDIIAPNQDIRGLNPHVTNLKFLCTKIFPLIKQTN